MFKITSQTHQWLSEGVNNLFCATGPRKWRSDLNKRLSQICLRVYEYLLWRHSSAVTCQGTGALAAAVLGCNLKNNRMISVHFQGKLFNITVYMSMPQTLMNRSWSWMVLWRCTGPSRNNTQNRCPFYHRDHSVKVGSQEIPGVTGKFGLRVKNEAGQKLMDFCQENTLDWS